MGVMCLEELGKACSILNPEKLDIKNKSVTTCSIFF